MTKVGSVDKGSMADRLPHLIPRVVGPKWRLHFLVNRAGITEEENIVNFFGSFLPQKYVLEAPFLCSRDFTLFFTTASTSNTVTHPSANCGPSCLTSVILRELACF